MIEQFKLHFYIAALPDLPLEFHNELENLYELECYPEFRLPFHVTLFYLGELSETQKEEVFHWFDTHEKLPALKATIRNLDFFSKDNKPTVYYLNLESTSLRHLNTTLEIFQHIHKDSFSFLPHMSLFFPKLVPTQKDRLRLETLFTNMKDLSFKEVYLGSVLHNITHIHRSIPCISQTT